MAKTSRPDRKKNDRRARKEPSEYEETTLSIDRVTRVVAGGRRLRFRAVVIVGNKKGKVGLGTGKANDVQSAVQKATADAKRNMIRIPLVEGSIPHEVDFKHKAARIRLMPAGEGTGVIAGGALRPVLEHAGVQNVLSKRFGTTNKLVNAQCVMMALGTLKGELPDNVDEPVDHTEKNERPRRDDDKREKKEAPPTTDQMKTASQDEEAMDGVDIKVVSKSDIDEDGTLVEKKEDATESESEAEAEEPANEEEKDEKSE